MAESGGTRNKVGGSLSDRPLDRTSVPDPKQTFDEHARAIGKRAELDAHFPLMNDGSCRHGDGAG